MRTRATPPRNVRRAPVGRSSREQLLNVRVRAKTARRQRQHRVLSVALGVGFWLALVAASVWGLHAVTQKFFLQNPEYNLRVIEADLDGLMTEEEALRISGLTRGENIFRLNLGAAEKAFRAIDQIESVTIQREWPDTLRIQLRKRPPVAWLAAAGGDFSADNALLLDAAGRPMHPYRIEPEYWRLPVIYAPDPDLIVRSDALAVADLGAALALLDARKQMPESLLDIRSIDITKGYALEVTDASKAVLTFSPENPAVQLQRVQKLLENCRDTGRQLESVNLIPKKFTPVRFLLASLNEPPAAKPSPSPATKSTPKKKATR